MVPGFQYILLTTDVCLDTAQVEVMAKGMDMDQIFTLLTFIYEYQFQLKNMIYIISNIWKMPLNMECEND